MEAARARQRQVQVSAPALPLRLRGARLTSTCSRVGGTLTTTRFAARPFRVTAPLSGPDPFGVLPRVRATLLATLASVHTPALAPGGAGLPHFDRPLNSLRTQLVLQLCEQRGVARLVDLGCGSADTVIAITRAPGWAGRLERYVGLDVSKGGLCAGCKKLARLLGDAAEPPRPAREVEGLATSDAGVDGTPLVFRCEASAAAGVPACELRACNVLQSSLANEPVAWGDLAGIDAAIMTEVRGRLLLLFGLVAAALPAPDQAALA